MSCSTTPHPNTPASTARSAQRDTAWRLCSTSTGGEPVRRLLFSKAAKGPPARAGSSAKGVGAARAGTTPCAGSIRARGGMGPPNQGGRGRNAPAGLGKAGSEPRRATAHLTAGGTEAKAAAAWSTTWLTRTAPRARLRFPRGPTAWSPPAACRTPLRASSCLPDWASSPGREAEDRPLPGRARPPADPPTDRPRGRQRTGPSTDRPARASSGSPP